MTHAHIYDLSIWLSVHLCVQEILNAGDTAYWTKLKWKLVFRSGDSLHIIVNSKSVAIGSISFSSKALLTAVHDDEGLRRVSERVACITIHAFCSCDNHCSHAGRPTEISPTRSRESLARSSSPTASMSPSSSLSLERGSTDP